MSNEYSDLSGEFLPEYFEEIDYSIENGSKNRSISEDKSSDASFSHEKSSGNFFDDLNLDLGLFSDIEDVNEIDDTILNTQTQKKKRNGKKIESQKLSDMEDGDAVDYTGGISPDDEEDLKYIKSCITSLEEEMEKKRLSLSMHQESDSESDSTPLFFSQKKTIDSLKSSLVLTDNSFPTLSLSKKKIARQEIENVLSSPNKGVDALLECLNSSEKKKHPDTEKRRKKKEKKKLEQQKKAFSSFFAPLDNSMESLQDTSMLNESQLNESRSRAITEANESFSERSDADFMDLFPLLKKEEVISVKGREVLTMDSLKRNWDREDEDDGEDDGSGSGSGSLLVTTEDEDAHPTSALNQQVEGIPLVELVVEQPKDEPANLELEQLEVVSEESLSQPTESSPVKDIPAELNPPLPPLEVPTTPTAGIRTPPFSPSTSKLKSPISPLISMFLDGSESNSSKIDIRIHGDFSVWNENSKLDPYNIYQDYTGVFPPINSYIRKKYMLVPLADSSSLKRLTREKKLKKTLEVVLPSILDDSLYYPVHLLECTARPDLELKFIVKTLLKFSKITGSRAIQTHRNRLFIFAPEPHQVKELVSLYSPGEIPEQEESPATSVPNTSSFSNFLSSFTSSGTSPAKNVYSSYWDVIDVQVILSKETRHRVIVFQFMKKIVNASTTFTKAILNSLSLGQTYDTLPLPSNPNSTAHLFKKNVFSKTWLKLLKREFIAAQIPLSTLYRLPLDSVAVNSTAESHGLDIQYCSLFKTLYKEKMWEKLKHEFSEREKKLESIKSTLSSFVDLFQQLLHKVHGTTYAGILSEWSGSDIEAIIKALDTSSSINSPYLKLIQSSEDDFRFMVRSPKLQEFFSPNPKDDLLSPLSKISFPSHLREYPPFQKGEIPTQKLDGMTVILLLIDSLYLDTTESMEQEYQERLGEKSVTFLATIESIEKYKRSCAKALISYPSVLGSPANLYFQSLFEDLYNDLMPNKLVSTFLAPVVNKINSKKKRPSITYNDSPPPPIVSETSSYWFKGWNIETITNLIIPEDSPLGTSTSHQPFTPTFSLPYSSNSLDETENPIQGKLIPKEQKKRNSITETEQKVQEGENFFTPEKEDQRRKIHEDETKENVSFLPPPREKVKTNTLASSCNITTANKLSLIPPFRSQVILCVYECICNGVLSELLISQSLVCIVQTKDGNNLFTHGFFSLNEDSPSTQAVEPVKRQQRKGEEANKIMDENTVYSREAYLVKNFAKIDVGAESNQVVLTFANCNHNKLCYQNINMPPYSGSLCSSTCSSSNTREITLLIPPSQSLSSPLLSPYEHLKILLPLLKSLK